MKKLLTLGLGALLACGVTACGPSYSKTVLSGDADKVMFHYVGGYEGSWAATSKNTMEATSVAEVAKVSGDVAKLLSKRSIKYLYMAEITVDKDAGWDAKFWNGTESVTVDGKYTVKSIRSNYETVDGEVVYGSFQWIPNPVTGGAAHVENLSEETLFIPPWQEEADEHGFDWSMNPVIKTQKEGKYQLIVAQYSAEATADTANFGLAVVAK